MSSRVKAVVRVRPPFKTEVVVPGYSNVVRTVTTNTAQKVIVAFQDHFREFDYDVVLGPEFKQDQVYQNVGAPLVDEVLKGYSSTLLAYGQTGTGKTYTLGILTAPRSEDQGIVTRALTHVFDYIETHPENDWAVAISCIQIYKEMIIDMLNPQHTNMALREDPQQGVFVEGLEALAVYSLPQALNVVNTALENRVMASTLMNATSSRSHTIIKIRLQQRVTQGFEGSNNQYKGLQVTKTVTGTLTLVDLAGSERIKKTNSSGERLEEAKSINVSLSTLGKVISALTTTGPKQAHIPFRDSKLTRLLQDSLGGHTNTTLIAAVGPSISHREETLSTLSFAMRCMKIKVTPTSDRVSVGESDYADWCLILQQQIANLQQEFKDKEAMYVQKIKSLSEHSHTDGFEPPKVRRSNSVSSVNTNRSSTPSSSRPGPDTWQPSHDFLFFHYQLLQEIAQTTVHLAQHTHAPPPATDMLDDLDDADELWAIARERIEEKISSIHMGNHAENATKPFMDEMVHPPLTEFSEERELIIYLIQLRSLINSNLDFSLHWMDTRLGVVEALKRQLVLQEVEAIRKQREMEVWSEAMNQLIAENKQLRHALNSKKRDFRIAQENSKLLKLRINEMNNSLSSQTKMANMARVPFITGHDLVRLDKAIRTLQLRFLGKRKRRMANNMRRLHSHHRPALASVNSLEASDLSTAVREGRGRRRDHGDHTSKYGNGNGNGVDASVPNDSTFDDVSINESSIASNDTTAEQHSEMAKKKNKRSLMHKLGGLFSSDKNLKTEGKNRSPQSSPDIEHRPGRSDSVASDRSSSSMGSTSSAVLESSITAQLLQHRLKLKTAPLSSSNESVPAHRHRSTSKERNRNAEALVRKASEQSDSADHARPERSSHRERARAPSPANDYVQQQQQSERKARQHSRTAADAELLLRRMTAAHERNEQAQKTIDLQNASSSDRSSNASVASDSQLNKSANPFSLSNFTQKRTSANSTSSNNHESIHNPYLRTDTSSSSVNSLDRPPPPPPSQYHFASTASLPPTKTKPSQHTEKKKVAHKSKSQKQPPKPPLVPAPKISSSTSSSGSDDDFSQLDQFEKELNVNLS